MTDLLSNRYQILRVLGSGGFGQTFLAEDTHMPSRRVCVLKQLTPITDNPQVYQLVKERFQREAVILESLGRSSDRIPELYAYFNDNGKFYLVQEWIDGQDLHKKVRLEGCLPEPEVRRLLSELLTVLSFVHSKGIIHRDIKPENIIWRVSDRLPVLIDFGAVKETLGTVVNSQGNATHSIVIGTPGFMPSEQAVGRVTFASDLYSLGLTAIYLLTAKMPQDLDVDASTGEISWHRYATNFSSELVSVLDRSIRFHPRDRYATAQDMLAALQAPASTVVSNYPLAAAVNTPSTPPPTGASSPTQPVTPSSVKTVAVGSPVGIVPEHSSPGHTVIASRLRGIPGVVQKSEGKAWLIGSVMAGLVVGGALAVGIGTQKWNSSTNISQVNSPAPTPTNEESTPEVSASPVPTAKKSANTSAIATPTPTLQSTTVPSASPSVRAISSPRPTQSPVSKAPSGGDPSSLPAPDQAVEEYYSTINSGQYAQAWELLSPHFQQNKAGSYNGSFLNWWRSVDKVTVDSAKVISKTDKSAVVDARLTYKMKDGSISPEASRITLVWDEDSKAWLFEDASP